jgi:predicted ATP-grasp superfamily ATP-dependent carboligase
LRAFSRKAISTKPRILLSEGSSLSAREAITALGLSGHAVEVVTSSRLCLGRFSRFVQRVHRAPVSGADPFGYLSAVLDVVRHRHIDVLLPTHEQAYLFAATRQRLPTDLGVALADFRAFEDVQNKTRFSALLSRLGVPQPETQLVTSTREFRAERPCPFFVKQTFGTAGIGVWRVDNGEQRDRLLQEIEKRGDFNEGLLLQALASGPLERAQAIFDHGRLVACHVYRQLAEGPGGGDVLKVSVHRPEARGFVARIGAALSWHGALSFDYILEDGTGQPRFIDANPRLVEPMNAWWSGTDLTGALLAVSLGEAPPTQPEGRPDILTRLSLMGLLDAAQHRGRRRDVLIEAGRVIMGSGKYKGAVEELTPLRADPWSALPVGLITAALLISPGVAAGLVRGTIRAYSLSPAAVRCLRELKSTA